MEKRICVAAVGDNCMDCYDDLGQSFPGGNPVNVAVYIRRLGGQASYTGAVGSDPSGRQMIEAIAAKGVDTSHVQVLEGKTAVSHVRLVEGDRVFGEYEEGVLADFKLRPEDVSFLCAQDLVATGIWGMIEGDLPSISQKVPVAFDFANKFASPIVDRAIPYVTYAFFSYDEESREDFAERCRQLGLGESSSDEEMLAGFMEAMWKLGPKAVIVTRGKAGSLAWDGSQLYRCGIVECEVVDTMGAGDSFIAGFLYGVLEGKTIPEAMRAGAENSAVTLGYSGAW
ncbi:PfkB family carbohydrate kinase [Oscillibacter sp. 1-3]|uniref:PfkB family carbohydrate kinase n=1 Tax=Oscillibacter sp. 1-3 TaxID=1235797 RepID=UPI00033F26B7|nr:PfkB family carbohydrate kinase [Oscillibacter sp. 1-3]EOS64623.1 hypothetical protein C816_02869 [Oscillibacter sp. 1-3]